MTEKRARALHRAMWRWLAKHPDQMKQDWPGWRRKNPRFDEELRDIATYYDRSFACYVADGQCGKCPIAQVTLKCSQPLSSWHDYVYSTWYSPDFDQKAYHKICNNIADSWLEIHE